MSDLIEQNNRTGSEIAVIGMTGRFPGAKNIHEFWENLKNGVESISYFTDEELKELEVEPELLQNPNYVKTKGGVLEDKDLFDASFFDYTSIEAEVMDPQIRIFHECAWEALEAAGYDSKTYKGTIGLYAGASSSSLWETYTVVSGKSDALGPMASGFLNDKDLLSTRIAYKLNLKGPAFTIQTACSTSLVAIHLASQAILNGECDMALAGGVKISSNVEKGYMYQEGMIFSQDGHCRAFDAKAKGTVSGEGVGVVVLKQLEEAIDQRDHIHAVIRGTAINNDGMRKVGYTAPSIEGQAEAIRVAWRMAEIEPEGIGYVESHGTGTFVGDPVEIEGLKLAFNTNKKGSCAIGSVKTNVGHLDAAAGVTGFIKTVLSLKHRLIPPSLHYETPNPRIDFENSIFYVNTTLLEWKRNHFPLRAGVSSFGLGGTNAHVVLEEALGIENSLGSPDWKLLIFSAKTPLALEQAAENLAAFFKNNPQINLADAAYTLQVGRCAFPHRRVVVCSGLKDAVEALSSSEPGKHPTFHTKVENRDCIFMFPGLGSQYVNMGLDLYQTEQLFREEMNRCFDILNPLVDFNIKEILYPGPLVSKVSEGKSEDGKIGREVDRQMGKDSHHSSFIIHHFEVAQAAVFITEYALTKLLMNWGIKPKAMIGYSFGEYTSACISGVFSLEDALKLIVCRGKLIGELSPGLMLSVPLTKEEISPSLDNELSIAIDNGPSCIVAGTREIVEAFEKQMKDKRILCMRLQTSHALHSEMMEPIIEKFKENVGKITLNAPQVPYISNVTGNWATAEKVTQPGYWATHLKQTVRFADGIKKMMASPNSIFIEIGPGRDLCAMVQKYINNDSDQHILNLIRHPEKDISDVNFLLSKIGRLWLYGTRIDWSGIHSKEKRHRIPLPTYPFEHRQFEAEGDPFRIVANMLSSGKSLLDRKSDPADWFYTPAWKRSRWTRTAKWNNMAPQRWLVFGDEYGLGLKLVTELEKKGKETIIVRVGTGFRKVSRWEYIVNPAKSHDYKSLFEELNKEESIPGGIVHLWGITEEEKWDLECIDKSLELGFYSVLNTAQEIEKLETVNNIQFMVVTNNMQEVIREERLSPLKAVVLGAVKGIPEEYENIKLRSIDVILPGAGSSQEQKLIRQLLKEFITETLEPVIAIRDNHRWVQIFEPERLETPGEKTAPLKKEGVYLVAGGLGGIGFELVRYLAKQVSPKLVLTGRSSFPARDRWEQWLSAHSEEDKVSGKIRKVQELEALGAAVSVFGADITNPDQMQDVVKRAEEQFGQINGIIHAAGIPDGTLLQLRTKEVSERVLSPKVRGVIVLDTIFKKAKLDFFILCSSGASIMPPPGHIAYCASNNFLDAFAKYKAHMGDRFTLSINWPRWKGVGMAVIGEKLNKDLSGEEAEGGISPEEGVEVFSRLLVDMQPQVVVSEKDLGNLIRQHLKNAKASSFMEIFEKTAVSTKTNITRRPDIDTEYAEPGNKIEQVLADTWSEFFGFEQVGIHDDFFELGGDSLKALILLPKIHKEFDVEIPLTEFFTLLTIEKLAEYINHAGKSAFSEIRPAEKKEFYALSSAQKRLYILQQMEKDSTGYNETQVVLLEGKINKDKLEKTFRELIRRHESLRTSILMKGDEPVQKIHDEVEFEVEYYSSHSTNEIIANFVRPFDLGNPPSLRLGLIKIGEDQHVLMMDKHHIITDEVSHQVFVEEFMVLYADENKVLPPLTLQYKDYAEWQNSQERQETLKKQEEYWIKEFEDEIPFFNLPTDYPRPAIQSFAGNVHNFSLSKEELGALKNLAAQQEVTLFMVLLSIFYILLSKLSSQEDIIVGTPTAGRGHADLQYIMGVFINTLALKNYPEQDKTFNSFLMQVKERTLKSFENQDYQFEDLIDQMAINVNRDLSRNPLFDVMFILQNVEIQVQVQATGKEVTDFKLKPYRYERQTSKFDMTLVALEVDHRMALSLEYCTRLFKKETIERFINYFKKIISVVIEAPAIKISDIEIISEQEKKQVLFDFNDTNTDYPKESSIYKLFKDQVHKTPHNIAIVFEGQQLSYKTMNTTINRLARVLGAKGAKPGTIIGIMVKRSLEMLVGIMAVLKTRAAYLPIDPQYPEERIKYMLKESSTGILLTQQQLAKQSSEEPHHIHTQKIVYLTEALSYDDKRVKKEAAPSSTSTDPAYVIYTSGSTGKPKGVAIEHRNVINFITGITGKIEFSTGKSILALTTVSFDIFVLETLLPLLKGLRIVIATENQQRDPQLLAGKIVIENVNMLQMTPSSLKLLMDSNIGLYCLENVDVLMIGGESFPQNLFERLKVDYKGSVYNMYGPTETTVWSSIRDLTGVEKIDIGMPIANTQIYIIDRQDRLLPMNVAGELCIGGDGLARGYLNRPELTVEKFRRAVNGHLSLVIGSSKSSPQTNDQCPMTNDRLYRTGDLARWLPDGNIECLGRIDSQVKLRGFRIELGEIESQLLTHDEIKEAVVIVKSDGMGDKHLCAYVVPNMDIESGESGESGGFSEHTVSELRELLSVKLPDYMIPAYFVPLKSIPLTPNGKIDRKALPEPELGTGTDVYTAPRDTIEIQLVRIWSEVLGIEKMKIGIDANFFAIGGHSLRATVMAGKVHKELNVDLPLAEIFKTPTIRRLSKCIKGLSEDKYVSIEPAEKKEYYPLSSAQKRLYFVQVMDERGISYNLPTTVILEGNPDKKRLEHTFRRLIERQESLRTSFQRVKDEPVQKIHEFDEVEFNIEYYDMKEVKVEEERSPVLEGTRGLAPLSIEPATALPSNSQPATDLIKNFIRPFDLSHAPLLRVGLIKEDEGKHILIFDMHHIISDGVSMGLLIREFMAFYSGKEMAEPRIQYKDFSEWQNSKEVRESVKQQETYWIKEFQGEIPVIHLPYDFIRPKVQSFEGSTLGFEIAKEETTALKAYALEQETTLFTVLLAVYNIFLSRLSSQEDIVVGSPIAGRRHSDLQHIVGMFVNTLALRNFPQGEKSFKQFLDDVKTRTLESFSNQDYLYEDLVERVAVNRDPGRNPLFDAAFILQNMETVEINITGLKLSPYNYQQRTSKFDFTLACMETREVLLCTVEYCTKLFKPATIERFINYFRKTMPIVIKNPAIKIADIEIISEEEKRQILYDFNDTEREYPKDKTIHRLFEEQAVKAPDNIAVVAVGKVREAGARALTYRQLNEMSNRLAWKLRELSGQPCAIVGIMIEASVEMIIGVLAILKIDGAYLPIKPEYPEERKKYLLDDANTKLLLTNSSQESPSNRVRETLHLDVPGIYDCSCEGGENTESGSGPGSLAYIIYTSGSTGRPKGVMVEHRSVVRLVKNTNYIRFKPGERILQTGALEFDASTFEIWGALLNGLALYLAPRDTLLAPVKLRDLIRSCGITTIWMTAPLFNRMVDAEIEIFKGLYHLLVGGDVLSPPHISRVRNRFPGLQVINGYGPTENTTFSTTFAIDKDYNRNIPIGSPIANSTAYIVDKCHRLVPIGVQGELLVGGDGVARGYLNNPELTAEKFDHDFWDYRDYHDGYHKSYRSYRSYILYKTGDLARWLPEGNIEFLGRIDFQVKIRGFRIELGEIETRLQQHPDVKEAVVLVKENESGEKYLCAYFAAGKQLSAAALRHFLTSDLPDYMIPYYFVSMERLPLTPNGKIDRKVLPQPEIKSEDAQAAPGNEIEAKLVDIWAQVLGIETEIIGIDSNFFELGGHSLRATVMAAKIHKELDVDFPLVEVFTGPTIREMAAWITAAGKTLFASIPAVEKKEYYDLSHAQVRMWTLSQLEEASIAFNIPISQLLRGKLDIPALERTFDTLLERHENFRTVFVTINGVPKQKILAPKDIDFKVDHIDLEGNPEKETKTRERVEGESVILFDLSRGPLLRFMLIRLEEEKHVFFLNMHHIISDYLSFNVFIEEMLILYGAFLEEKPNPLESLCIQYKDYAAWHNEQLKGEQLNQHREYWLRQLEGKLPQLELPRDKERPAVQTYNGDNVSFTFDEAFFIKLKTFSENNNVTLFMTLLTALNLLFYHYSGQTDILLGTVIAGREHADLRDQVGYYLNTLALRTRFDSRDTFTAVLDNVKTVLTDAYQHQVYPFDQLVEDLGVRRDRARHPIFDVMVDMLNYNADHEETLHRSGSGNIRVEGFNLQITTAHFDLTVIFTENKNTMDVSLEYNTDLFERTTIERMVNRFKKLLDTVLEKPGSVVSELQLGKKVQAPMIQRISRGMN